MISEAELVPGKAAGAASDQDPTVPGDSGAQSGATSWESGSL